MKAMPGLIMTMCLALFLPSVARAQDVATSFSGIRAPLKPGQTVIVTQLSGATLRGTFTELTALEIRFETSGRPQRVGQDTVQSISVIEHRVTGLGPIVGGAAGLGFGIFLVEATRDCGGCGSNGANALRALTAGLGALLGATIERAHGHKRLLYSAPPKAVSIAPILLPSRKGLEVRISF